MTKQEKVVRDMIRMIGDNPDRSGLKDTPKRIVKMWAETFRAYREKPPILTTFKNGDDGIDYDQMVADSGYFYSHCEHHGVPFFGNYFFAYIPDKKVVGLSKIARVVSHFSAKFQIQERLAAEVVNYIESELRPSGIALILEARHLCKEMRGVKQHGGIMITSEVRGAFRDRSSGAREEFLRLINNIKNSKTN
jgi:GTP cyclohydrolase I